MELACERREMSFCMLAGMENVFPEPPGKKGVSGVSNLIRPPFRKLLVDLEVAEWILLLFTVSVS
jgi:hypothetical protein